MSRGKTLLQVLSPQALLTSSIVSLTAPALVYGPKYRDLSFFCRREKRTLGKSSPRVTLM